MPELRYATLQDVTPLAAIASGTFYNTYAAYNTPEDIAQYMLQYFSPAHIQTEIEENNTTILLAIEKSEIVGYAKVIWGTRPGNENKEKALEIARLYAATNYIGTGIGKFLIQHCFEYAKNSGTQYIWLGVWHQNKKAIRFYEQFGFEIVGTYIFLLGKDEQQDYIMERKL